MQQKSGGCWQNVGVMPERTYSLKRAAVVALLTLEDADIKRSCWPWNY
jgi:hypothetical protein